MEANEHHYSDDPRIGHIDVRTTLKDVEYFFLGNGFLEAAVQYSPSGEGTPLGLLIMDVEKFGPKRKALTMHQTSGIQATMISISYDGSLYSPAKSGINIAWTELQSVPAVKADWEAGTISVNEIFYCPDRELPRLVRTIRLLNNSSSTSTVRLKTGIKRRCCIDEQVYCQPKMETILHLEYKINSKTRDVVLSQITKGDADISEKAMLFWSRTASIDFGCQWLNRLFSASKYHLQANTSSNGCMDASIWQYNLEWVRDQSNVVIGMIVAGQFELAYTILDRMLQKFVTDDGATVDSSRVRPYHETELDQNGALLLAVRTYVDWTGDFSLVKKHWDKVKAVADFPLKSAFEHPCGLLHNQRDLWERHGAFGIEDGFELSYQFYSSLGLAIAAGFAKQMNYLELADKWENASAKIRKAMLGDPKYSMIDNGHFIKRRRVDSSIQYEVHPQKEILMSPEVELAKPQPHYLNPDCGSVLPITHEFIDPKSDLSLNTLNEVEKLCNMNWSGGGHSRYNISSEPDSPGPWPLASVIIAQAWFQAGNDEMVYKAIDWLEKVSGGKSGGWFEFYGPRPIPPCPQVGLIPWTWGEVMKLYIHHFLGVRPSENSLVLKPRLLDGLEQMNANIRIRNFKLSMSIRKAKSADDRQCLVDGEKIPFDGSTISIPMPDKDVNVEIHA